MKTFISTLSQQFFVERLDLSGNEQLGQYFAQYVLSALAQQDRADLAAFRFEDGSGRVETPELPRRPGRQRRGGAPGTGSAEGRGPDDALVSKKAAYNRNFLIASKNPLLLYLNLKRCLIGQSSLEQINRVLAKNRDHRERMKKTLQLQEEDRLREY